MTEMSIPVPLDDDGFLRRACPSCEREFKWLPSEGVSTTVETETQDYFCPYCGSQAKPDAWFTGAQLEHVRAVALGHATTEISKSLMRAARTSKAMTFKPGRSETPAAPTESNDMRRVDFDCHPSEPIKISEDWSAPIHCLICNSGI